jgi:hypothetical protein
MNPKLLLCLALVLSGGSLAFGYSVEIPVTPGSLDQGKYVFLVFTNLAQSRTSFDITIIAKTDTIPTNTEASLDIVTHWRDGTKIELVKPTTRILLKKNDHAWKCDFIASNESLTNADLCFVFLYHNTRSGMASAFPSFQI